MSLAPVHLNKLKTLTSSLADAIYAIEELQSDLEIEQEESQEEADNFNPDAEGAVEPEIQDHQKEIDELEEILDFLRQAEYNLDEAILLGEKE